mgnify:FL=1
MGVPPTSPNIIYHPRLNILPIKVFSVALFMKIRKKIHAYLPPLHPLLPRNQFLQTLHPPLPLVNQNGHAPHHFQSLLDIVIVFMVGFRVLEQLGQLQRVLADPLYRRQQIPIQRNLDQSPHQTASLEELAVVVELVEFLQGGRRRRMAIAVLGVHLEPGPVLEETTADATLVGGVEVDLRLQVADETRLEPQDVL